MSDEFTREFDVMARHVHELALKKGWWDGARNDGEAIALMHSELSEALESMRDGWKDSSKIPNFLAVEEELADVIIRIMDFARGRDLDVANAIVAKNIYNHTRTYKHGKRF